MARPETQQRASASDPFWWDDPSVLIRPERCFEFYPATGMSRDEKLNAMSRFGLYGSLLLYAYSSDPRALYALVAALLFTGFVHHGLGAERPESFSAGPPSGAAARPPVARRMEDVRDPLENRSAHLGFPSTLEVPENADKPFLARPAIAQSFGSDAPVYPPLVQRPDGAVCVAPTKSNPYMNVLVSELTAAPDRPAACSLQDSDVLKAAEDGANFNLYRDVSDLFGNMTHTRAFYTMPSTTIPNDRDSFAKFCFGDINKGCKAGHLENCVRNADLRQQRGTVDEVMPMLSASPISHSTATVG